jgi:hypothetical protein
MMFLRGAKRASPMHVSERPPLCGTAEAPGIAATTTRGAQGRPFHPSLDRLAFAAGSPKGLL